MAPHKQKYLIENGELGVIKDHHHFNSIVQVVLNSFWLTLIKWYFINLITADN